MTSSRYGRTQALRGASLELRAGEILAVTGASGSGKSTLLHCLAGIVRPDSGSVTYAGERLDRLPEKRLSELRRTEFGVVFQFGQLIPELTALDNVALPLMLAGTGRRAAQAAAGEWLERFGVRGQEQLRPGEMSGVMGAILAVGAGAVWLSGATARLTGRLLACRARSAAVLIAAGRLRDDPWAAARTHAAVLLVTVVGTGFVGLRQWMLEVLDSQRQLAEGRSFYTTGLDLTAAALVVALAITLSGLAVGTAESLATRRRGLAAQTAAGVPRSVLGRALLLETALPLAPALLLAGAGGAVIGFGYAVLAEGGGWSLPWVSLLVPFAVYATCLLAATTALPLLRRTVRPAELRYA
ncbi:hypothetical protein GCM10009601_05380 [Streptomyces thermospinosisporus]|uniref:ABC transporter domain-containing protein n=1 Tax=Streptomyces thermospinosisporus TaxID=161482 RepID=A0ABN1YJD9_9ACTN